HGAGHGAGRAAVRLPVPHPPRRASVPAGARRNAYPGRALLRSRDLFCRGRLDAAHPHGTRAPVAARGAARGRPGVTRRKHGRNGRSERRPHPFRSPVMEALIAIAIGVLGGSGVWLVLRPRTFQVVMGLTLLSYAVNLFSFSMGSLAMGREPIIKPGLAPDLLNYTDPLPQALVLTAIVISFATTALFLVVLLALRGLSGTDHVDGDRGRE